MQKAYRKVAPFPTGKRRAWLRVDNVDRSRYRIVFRNSGKLPSKFSVNKSPRQRVLATGCAA